MTRWYFEDKCIEIKKTKQRTRFKQSRSKGARLPNHPPSKIITLLPPRETHVFVDTSHLHTCVNATSWPRIGRARVPNTHAWRWIRGSRLIGYKSQHVASIHLAVHYPDENVYTLDILPDATVAILIMAVTCRGEDEASNTNGLANRLFGVGSSFFERISQEGL